MALIRTKLSNFNFSCSIDGQLFVKFYLCHLFYHERFSWNFEECILYYSSSLFPFESRHVICLCLHETEVGVWWGDCNWKGLRWCIILVGRHGSRLLIYVLFYFLLHSLNSNLFLSILYRYLFFNSHFRFISKSILLISFKLHWQFSLFSLTYFKLGFFEVFLPL